MMAALADGRARRRSGAPADCGAGVGASVNRRYAPPGGVGAAAGGPPDDWRELVERARASGGLDAPAIYPWSEARSEAVRSALSGADDGSAAPLPEYTLEEVAQHTSAKDMWVVVDGRVLDVSGFGETHPGGERALVNLAGTDATDVFEEIHAPTPDFLAWMESFAIGTLKGGSPPRFESRPRHGDRPWEDYSAQQLDSPFPARRFHGSGLEAFRFEWGILDRLLARDPEEEAGAPGEPDAREPGEPLKRWGTRQKAKIAPLDDQDRDWLEVGEPRQYVAEMQYRETLLTGEESRALVFVSNPDEQCRAGQAEVLEQMLECVPPLVIARTPHAHLHRQLNASGCAGGCRGITPIGSRTTRPAGSSAPSVSPPPTPPRLDTHAVAVCVA